MHAEPYLTFYGYTGLHVAALSECKPGEQGSRVVKETMRFLVEELNFDVNYKENQFSWCPLHCTCCSANKAAMEFLLEQPNIELDHLHVDHNGDSILYASSACGNVEMLKLVLEKVKERGDLSYQLNNGNYAGDTPMKMALQNDNLPIVNTLLQFAGNDEYGSIDPHLVLDSSQGRETDTIVEFFKTSDPKFLARRSDGATVLHLVVERGWARAAREIAVKEPSLLNEKDNHDRTPLHYAALVNKWEIVDLLMNQ